MRKTIKVDALRKEIEKLVKRAIRYYKEGNSELYEYCYDKAIAYVNLIEDLCIDYKKSSYEKEHNELGDWFSRITNEEIYK